MDKYYLSDRMKRYINSTDNDKYKVNKLSLKLNRDIACTKSTREGYTRADSSDYICNDLPFKEGDGINVADMDLTQYRIRKLIPTECFKLQGFTAEDCKKASNAGVSNSQLYKQAGNSICVAVLEAIYKSLSERYDEFKPMS